MRGFLTQILLILSVLSLWSQSAADYQSILQKVLDDPNLQTEYITDEYEGGDYLFILNDKPELENVRLFHNGVPVKIWLLENIFFQGIKNYLIITETFINEKEAHIELNIVGSKTRIEANFLMVNDDWIVTNRSVRK